MDDEVANELGDEVCHVLNSSQESNPIIQPCILPDHFISPDEAERKIRRSSRDIKRPKFDDELVESALTLKTSPMKRRASMERSLVSPSATSHSLSPTPSSAGMPWTTGLEMDSESVFPSQPQISSPSHVTVMGYGKAELEEAEKGDEGSKIGLRKRLPTRTELDYDMITASSSCEGECRRRESRVASKDMKCKELAAASELVDPSVCETLKTWSAEDDVALLTNATHVCDLEMVAAHTPFSHPYSIEEVEQRWYQLLYDDVISKLAKKRFSELSVEQIERIQARTVFSLAEEELLMSLTGNPPNPPTVDNTAVLLKDNSAVFHHSRTPQILLEHWLMLRACGLLPAQSSRPLLPPLDLILMERQALLAADSSLGEARAMRAAMMAGERVSTVPVTGVSLDKLEDDVIGILRGRLMKYKIKTDRISIGRSTATVKADVNLTLEGPALCIARRQATLTRDATGIFILKNVARRPIFVDGKTLLQEDSTQIVSNSVIEMAHIRLVFKSI